MKSSFDTVVFDLGGVLVDWNPRYLYRKLFRDTGEMEEFLAGVCNSAWNEQQDAGRTLAEGTARLIEAHPAQAEMIRAFYGRWAEMLNGPIEGTVEILRELHSGRRQRLFALSNWSAETFPIAFQRYSFFTLFEAILLSGRERMIKPDPKFFALLSSRHGVDPKRAVFVDDVSRNIEAARKLGFHAIQFTDPPAFREQLVSIGVLPRP